MFSGGPQRAPTPSSPLFCSPLCPPCPGTPLPPPPTLCTPPDTPFPLLHMGSLPDAAPATGPPPPRHDAKSPSSREGSVRRGLSSLAGGCGVNPKSARRRHAGEGGGRGGGGGRQQTPTRRGCAEFIVVGVAVVGAPAPQPLRRRPYGACHNTESVVHNKMEGWRAAGGRAARTAPSFF